MSKLIDARIYKPNSNMLCISPLPPEVSCKSMNLLKKE